MPDIWSLVLTLLGATFFATLTSAFAVTAEAGLDRLAEKFPARADRIQSAAGRWDRMRVTLLLCTVALEIAAVARILALGAGTRPVAAWVLVLLSVPVLAVLLHLGPNTFAESYADRLSVAFLAPVSAIDMLLFPLSGPLIAAERSLHRHLRARSGTDDRPTPEDEIISLVDQTADHDLEHEEREIIRSVFEFGSTVAREIMTPRVRMTAFEGQTPVADSLQVVRDSGYSRYPVFDGSIDRVAGIAHARDLLLAAAEGQAEAPIRGRVQRTSFVPETMPISDLLKLLRTRRQHLAIVVDEYGGTAGLVTMEDVLEELIGEIRDEFDTDEVDLPAPAGNTGVFDASLPVDELNEAMGIKVPDADHYDSIGGFIVSELGYIPPVGAVLQKTGFQMTVEEATERQVRRVRVERVDPADSTA